MKLIYIDDYGNTGNKLDDNNQPIFLLFSLIVPEAKWAEIEFIFNTHVRSLANECHIDSDSFEVHAANFFSIHNKFLKNLSLDRRSEFAYKIITSLVDNDCKFICSYVEKRDLLKAKEALSGNTHYDQILTDAGLMDSGIEIDLMRFAAEKILEAYLSPYPITFSILMDHVNLHLDSIEENGIIIIDEQQQFSNAVNLKSFIALRQMGHSRIQEKPLVGDSRFNKFLQLADLAGYLTGHMLKSRLGYRKPIERHEKSIDKLQNSLTLVNALRSENGSFSRRANIFISEFGSHLMGIQISSHQVTGWATKATIKKEGEEHPEGSEQQ